MKKVLLAALMTLFMASYLTAAGEFVKVDTLEASGLTVIYDWKLNKAEISGGNIPVKITLNYPFIFAGEKSYRIDAPPYIQDGSLFISAYTAGKIKEAVSETIPKAAETAAIEAPVQPVKISKTEDKSAARSGKKHAAKAIPAPVAAVETVKAAAVETATEIPAAIPAVAITKSNDEQKKVSSVRKLIVLDPGHGGNDPGATGYNGLREKDVVLAVAKLVKQHLRAYNADVLLTRDTDEFITLKNRAVFANARKADLFVSIHCNASDNRTASGTRSYIYDRVASSKEAAAAAKFENKSTGAFEFLMNDLRKSAYEYLSIEAAGNIQQNLISGLKLKWLPTERAPFYVIANTNMPSVLVEIAFISNPKEEQKLDSAEFKDKVSINIASGITQYLSKVK